MEGKRVADSEVGRSFAGKAVLAALGLALVVTAAAAGFGVYANHIYEGVFPGVKMSGVSLEGKSLQDANAALEQTLSKRLSATVVTITAGGETLGMYDMTTLGAHAETEETAAAAYAVGREKGAVGWVKNALTMAKGLLGGTTEFSPVVSYDEDTLDAVIGEIAQRFDTAAEDASYELTAEGLFVTKERTGRTLDREALAQSLREAETAVTATWTKNPGQSLDLQALSEELSAEPLSARYDHASGKVVDGQVGVAIDVEAAQYVLDAAAEGETVQLPAEVTYPKMTAAQLEAVLFRDVLSTASTKVSGSAARKGNVRLSAEFCNGIILNPGEVFDFNTVVGERTAERGFGKAAAYVNGETVDELGGGICQTSSTIYYASLLANLEIVERKCHRYVSGYIEKGMDATVSWGGPEFRFRNDTDYPIRLETIYEKNVLTVNFYGTKTDDTYVKMTHKVLSTTPHGVVRQETEELPYGTEQRKQSGYTGYVVETYRSLYDGAGNLLSTAFEDKSVYRSRDEIILVGTAGKPAVNPDVSVGGTTGADEAVDGTTGDGTAGSESVDTGGAVDGGTSADGEEPSLPPEEDSEPEPPPIIQPDGEMPNWGA